MRRRWGVLLVVKLCNGECGKQKSVEGGGESVVLAAGENGERGKGSDGAEVLGWSGVLEKVLASVVPVKTQGGTVCAGTDYFSCQLKHEALVYFEKQYELLDEKFCGQTVELFVIIVLKG